MSIIQQKNKDGNRINSKAEYLEFIKNQKYGTRSNKVASVNNFDLFCQSQYNHPSSEFMVTDMLENLDALDGIYGILSEWVQWNIKDNKLSSSSLPIYLCWLRKYLHMRGVKIDLDDMKNYFSKHDTMTMPLKEKKYAVKLSELQSIIGISKLKQKQLYILLISSGMRLGEALSMKKEDLSFEYERVMITIPAENAKNKEERITFMSEEARKMCQPLFDGKGPKDMIFGSKTCTLQNDVANQDQIFDRIRKKLGLVQRYKSGRNKVSIHSMRAFFISKIIKQNENLGHYLAGHSVYMKQYERFETEELIEAYMKSEPELTILDLTRKDNEIAKLKNSDHRVKELENKVELFHKLILSLGVEPKLLIQKVKELEYEE